ncbi:MAG: multiheme c-type cytochrome [Planctomycetota bacterium]
MPEPAVNEPTRSPRRFFRFTPASILACLIGLGLCSVFADYWTAEPLDAQRTFVGRQTCAECHAKETESFVGSDHDKAMDLATDETVLGDFGDVTFENDGIKSRLFRDGNRFMVHTEGEDGELADFEVKYVFGVYPLQQYMVEFDRDEAMDECEVARLQVLRISWNSRDNEWFYLRPPDVPEKLAADDPLHWTGIAQRWQTMCADCHSTNLKRNFDTETLTYHTTFSEIDVSCEACHGPGSLHVKLANKASLFWDRRHGYGLAKLKGEDPEPQLQSCAPCHSRRGVMNEDFTAGDEFCDHYRLESLGEATYHGDGQIKDEVYVYGSFIQSKMYHKGIRCTDCHDPHSLKLKHPGNETCTSCHQHAAGKYDVPSHHHHAPGTEGAKCVNCHMPHTTYMDVDARRDHSLRVPRPDLSVTLGTPNACSHCHVRDRLKDMTADARANLDAKEYSQWLLAAEQDDSPVTADNRKLADLIRETDQWCDDACETWYGAQRNKTPHFAETLIPIRRRDPKAIQEAIKLLSINDERAPAIAKATTLDALARSQTRGLERIAGELTGDDQHPMVRSAAASTLGAARPTLAKSKLILLLADPSRLVRTSAAQAIIQSPVLELLSLQQRNRLETVIEEVHEELMVASDRSGAHMAWASYCERLGRPGEAIESYKTAIRVEPQTSGARSNLANLLERLAPQLPPDQAADVIRQSAQLKKQELPLLARDAKLAPDLPMVQYRYGLALYLDGQLEASLKQLRRAVELAPENPEYREAVKLLLEKMDAAQ